MTVGPSHIWRPSLPWRTADQTECGLFPKGALAERCIPREEIERFPLAATPSASWMSRYRLGLCFSCQDTWRGWPTWEEDPIRCLARESGRSTRRTRVNAEMRALVALVAAHRAEYDDLREAELVLGTLLEMGR